MTNFLEFMQTQWANIVTLLGLLLSGGVIIAKWTKTPKDDEWFAKLLNWLNLLPVSAKQKLEDSNKQ